MPTTSHFNLLQTQPRDAALARSLIGISLSLSLSLSVSLSVVAGLSVCLSVVYLSALELCLFRAHERVRVSPPRINSSQAATAAAAAVASS